MPPTKSDLTVSYIEAKWRDLEPRFQYEWNRMRLVEAWRTLNKEALRSQIWSGVAQQDWGNITIVKNHVSSVTASAIALASSPKPSMSVKMKNRVSPRSQDRANYNRRAALGMRSEVNRNRTQPFEDEVTDYIFSRGVGITKHWYSPPEERGERRETVTADLAREFEDEPLVSVEDEDGIVIEQERIVEDGEFPGNVEVLDPLDCVYVIGPGKSGVKLFIHSYRSTVDDILAAYPDADKLPCIQTTTDIGGSDTIQCYDYWDEKYHAIAIGGEFYYEPTEHNLRRLPFEIERVNEQKLFIDTDTGGQVELPSGLIGRLTQHEASHLMVVTPFPWPMIDDVAKASFAESLLASKLPEMANTPIIHHGISTGEAGRPASPYFQKEERVDGSGNRRISRVPRYQPKLDKTSGGRPIWPAFDSENFMPLNPTPMADHLAIFMQQRNADLEISGMNAELLSGRIRSEPSGFSVNQQIQLTSARMNPYVGARNRLVSKTYTGIFGDLRDNWDRGEVPFILTDLTGEDDVPLTREVVDNVVEVVYEVENIFPRDRDAEMQMAFQMHSQGAMPTRELMSVYGAESPKDWQEQIIWEQVVLRGAPANPFMQQVAAEYQKKLGYGDMQPTPEAQQQVAGMNQAQALGQMMGQPPAPEGEGEAQAPNGQVPPEMAAALAAAGQGGQ